MNQSHNTTEDVWSILNKKSDKELENLLKAPDTILGTAPEASLKRFYHLVKENQTAAQIGAIMSPVYCHIDFLNLFYRLKRIHQSHSQKKGK